MITEGSPVEVLYPAHIGERGKVTRIVPRKGAPAMIRVLLESGTGFICDETMVKPL